MVEYFLGSALGGGSNSDGKVTNGNGPPQSDAHARVTRAGRESAQTVLTKPFLLEELRAAIDHLMRERNDGRN